VQLDGKSTDILSRLLAASELRGQVIAGNIANQNTPGYQRRVVSFEEKLLDELRDPAGDPTGVEAKIELDDLAPIRPDGNNVNLELELNSMRENRLLYETYASILSAQFRMMDNAITGGR